MSLVRQSFYTLIHSFIPQSVLLQVSSLFQTEFSTGCYLVLPLSVWISYLFLKVFY